MTDDGNGTGSAFNIPNASVQVAQIKTLVNSESSAVLQLWCQGVKSRFCSDIKIGALSSQHTAAVEGVETLQSPPSFDIQAKTPDSIPGPRTLLRI